MESDHQSNGASGTGQRALGRRPNRRRRIVVGVCIGLLVAFLADLGYVVLGLNNHLRGAADSLDQVRDELEDGNLPAARSALDAATDGATEAEGLLAHPAWKIIDVLPVIGDDTDAIGALVASANLISAAGRPGLEAAEVLDYRGESVGSTVYQNGRINLEVISEAAPLIDEVGSLLEDATDAVAEIGDAILPPVRSAVDRARTRVGDAAETASRAVTLLRLLPRLTGDDASRRYLLAFQALGEARATGGVAGLFGVLTAEDGKLRLGRIAPHTELSFSQVPAASVPGWYRRAYGVQAALKDWRQANLSPNFAVDARVMLEMYERSFGEELDGVLAVDAVALSRMMRGTGSFSVPGFDEKITPDNVVRILSNDAYVEFPTREAQNVFLAQLVRAFWSRIEDGSVNFKGLAEGLGEAVESRHVAVYATDAGDQRDLEALGVDGSLKSFGPNVQMVFHNNYAVNKVDYFLYRSIDTSIEIGTGGDLRVTTEVSLRNDAPAGPASDLLGGLDTNLRPGANRMILNFLLPEGARPGRIRVDGDPRSTFRHSDSGYPVVWDVLVVRPGEEAHVALTYVVPQAASVGPSAGELAFAFVPQPALNPETATVSVEAPGYALSDGQQSSPHEFSIERELTSPLALALRLDRL
jgi:Protein of unknown function (DUF4012)